MANINKDDKVCNELYNRVKGVELAFSLLYDDYIQFLDSLRETPTDQINDKINGKIESLIKEINWKEK